MKRNLDLVKEILFGDYLTISFYKTICKVFENKIGYEILEKEFGRSKLEAKALENKFDPDILKVYLQFLGFNLPLNLEDILILTKQTNLTWEDEKLMLEFFTKLKEDLRKFAKEDKKHVKELLESAGYGKLDYKMIEALRRRLERKEGNFRKEFVDSIETKDDDLGELKIWQ